jgi:hypothetical protein
MDTGNPADTSEVEIRLTAAGPGSTTLELEHTAVVPDEMWDQFGPGAVGVGWDGGMLGLSLHLAGGGDRPPDPIAWQVGPEGREFNRRCADLWGQAAIAAGADPEAARIGVANTTQFYAPDPGAEE